GRAFKVTPLPVFPAFGVAGALIVAGCTSSLDPTLGEQSALTCDEFRSREEIDGNVDANVRAFMEATVDVEKDSVDVRAKVRNACAAIAKDLGANDTWTSMGDVDDAVWNDHGTGACNAASTRIREIMDAHADAHFALVVTHGQCHRDFAAQADCENK